MRSILFLSLSLVLSACGGQDASIQPQSAEPERPRSYVVDFYADKGIPSFPPVERADVLVIAFESPDLPPGFMRGGNQLILADDVPTPEEPHQVIGLMDIGRILPGDNSDAIIRAYVEAGRKRGANAVVHQGCAPLTPSCKAMAVRLSTAKPAQEKKPAPLPTATWPAPTMVPAVPKGRVVDLPYISFIEGVSAIDKDRMILIGSAELHKDGGQERWVGRLGNTGKIDFKSIGEGLLYDVVAKPDGGAVLAGVGAAEVKQGSFEKTVEAAWIGEIKPDNKIIWQQTFTGELSARADGLAILPKGGVVAAGLRIPLIMGRCDALLSAVDSKGATLWDSTIGGPGYQFFNDVAVLASGRIIAVGAIETNASKNLYDGWILVTEPGGEVITKRATGRGGWNRFASVTGVADGGAVALGQSTPDGMFRQLIGTLFITKLDANGERVWEQSLGDRITNVTEIIEVQGGTMFAATKSEGDEKFSSWLVKVDMEGKDTWEPIQMDPKFKVAGLSTSPDGGLVLVAGQVRSARQVWVGRSAARSQ